MAAHPTPEEIELHWLRHVYAGDHVRPLTIRSVDTGLLLGGLMALSNLYVSLKTGWSLGVTVTAAILAFGIWTTLRAIFPRLTPFGRSRTTRCSPRHRRPAT
jgi:hypothetical protein